MGTEVRPPDLEAWATGYTRALLASRELASIDDLTTVEVSNKWPGIDVPFPDAAVIFRDDGGPKTSIVTWTRSLGVSVLAGTRHYDEPARDLAWMLFGALTDESLPLIGGPGCPITAVDDTSGPYPVTESQDRTLIYFTVTYAVFGTPVA